MWWRYQVSRSLSPCPRPLAAWLQQGAGMAASLRAGAGSASRADRQKPGLGEQRAACNQRGHVSLLSSCFDGPRCLAGSSAAAVLIDPRFLLLTQPRHTSIADLIHSMRQTTDGREFSLPSFAFPVGLGSQAPTVQEGDKNRRAPRRLWRHYSETGSSGLVFLEKGRMPWLHQGSGSQHTMLHTRHPKRSPSS